MRLLWSCILVSGLFLVGLELYQGGQTTTPQTGVVTALEDGSPCPTPYPTPKQTK